MFRRYQCDHRLCARLLAFVRRNDAGGGTLEPYRRARDGDKLGGKLGCGYGDGERLQASSDLDAGVPVVFGDVDLLREFVAEFWNVGNYANHATGYLEALDGFGNRRKGVRIEGAEAFVDKQAVQVNGSGGVLHLPA